MGIDSVVVQSIEFGAPDGPLSAIQGRPTGAGPWPGVVVVHDAVGPSVDLGNHVEMLADYGYLTVAPNLFSRGRVRCLTAIMRALLFTGEGAPVRDVLAAREHLLADPDCNGRTAVVGFCMGGGFALLVAPRGFDVSAPFYPSLRGDYGALLAGACPIVASYGALDPVLIGAGTRLEKALTDNAVPHDIRTYPGVTHGFANILPGDRLLRVTGLGHDEAATRDAWARIFAFFDTHLTGPDGDG